MLILVLNCGSSSIKVQVIRPETQERLISGLLSEIGSPHASFRWQTSSVQQVENHTDIDYQQGIALILRTISSGPGQVVEHLTALDGIGHRVVHGGERFTESTLITPDVLAEIEACIPLAPLHNPANVQGIQSCQALLPAVPQVAVFDTAFHQTLPPHAYLYAIPYDLYE
nr:acetate kinase [Ardenticatenales bacterium]